MLYSCLNMYAYRTHDSNVYTFTVTVYQHASLCTPYTHTHTLTLARNCVLHDMASVSMLDVKIMSVNSAAWWHFTFEPLPNGFNPFGKTTWELAKHLKWPWGLIWIDRVMEGFYRNFGLKHIICIYISNYIFIITYIIWINYTLFIYI